MNDGKGPLRKRAVRFALIASGALGIALVTYGRAAAPIYLPPGGKHVQAEARVVHHCRTGMPCGGRCIPKAKVCHATTRLDPHTN